MRDEPLPEPRHIPALDGVRGLAIAPVMMTHFADYAPGGSPANWLYAQIAATGWIGVDLFFVLSGFLITGLLIDAKGAPNYLRNFWARRVLRIFPAYYACLFMWFFVIPHLFPHFATQDIEKLQRDAAWYWSYLSNWRMGLDGEWSPLGTSVYWSLAIEEQFYLVWPVVVLLCGPRSLARFCVALIIIALVTRIWLVAAGAHPILIYTSTPTRMDTLAIGALIAVLARNREMWQRARQCTRYVLPTTMAIAGGIWVWLGHFSLYHPLVQTVGFTALSIGFGSAIVQILSSPPGWISQLLSHPALRFLGKYSYAMYLFHETIAVLVIPRVPFAELHPDWSQGARLVLLTAITFAAALLSWHLFEKHFLSLKRFFPATGAPLSRRL